LMKALEDKWREHHPWDPKLINKNRQIEDDEIEELEEAYAEAIQRAKAEARAWMPALEGQYIYAPLMAVVGAGLGGLGSRGRFGPPSIGRPTTTAGSGGRVFYGTPKGQVIEAPPGYQAVTAVNGRGLVLLPEGQALGNNANAIRYGEPNALNPNGYIRYYNGSGQPLNPVTGQPGTNAATHIPPSYQGPLNGYPGR
jgi:hypothetical protein